MQQQKTRDSEALTKSLSFKSRWNFIEQTNLFGLINIGSSRWFPTHYLVLIEQSLPLICMCTLLERTLSSSCYMFNFPDTCNEDRRGNSNANSCSPSGLLRNEFRIWVGKTQLLTLWHDIVRKFTLETWVIKLHTYKSIL